MTKGSKASTRTQDGMTAEALLELARSMGEICKNNAQHYWLSSRDAEDAADGTFLLLTALIADSDGVSFKLSGDTLTVNDVTVPCDESPVDFLVARLAERGLADFRFEPEMTRRDFRRFVDLINADPDRIEEEGGCTASAKSRGIEHFTVRRVFFKEVAEDEIVVQKEAVHEEGSGEWVDTETLSSIVAFLHGGPLPPDEKIRERVQIIAADSEKMVDLIMRSVDIRHQRASLEFGESLADVVVGGLRRAVEVLKAHPATKSRSGRKKLAKTLVMLEREMLEAIRGVADPGDLRTAREISATIREMGAELEVDALAGDYMRKRRASEQSERRLLRYMRDKGREHVGAELLRDRLEEDGLSSDGWSELVVKSRHRRRAEPVASGEERGLMALGQLARLLSQMERIATHAQDKPQSEVSEELGKTATTVRRAVKGAMEGAQEKIRELAREIEEDARAEKAQKAGKVRRPRRLAMERKRTLEVLAEIVQELCQPLSVINCSLQMVISGRLGGVTESQVSMLKLADESAERITMLTDSLRKISGEPETLEPDLDITGSFYRKT